MENKLFVTVAAALLTACAAQLHAEDRDNDGDTRHAGKLKEVVVTGTRSQTDSRNLPVTVSIVDRQTIEERMQPSLLPVLTEQVPGLFVTSRGVMGYGVSGGAAGGISMRGLSGGSGQMMVLIDGHPQYMGLMGHPIADACQSFWAGRVEVVRSPASVVYGSNAMGGVINIITRGMDADGVRTNVNAGYGSYNTLQSEFATRFRRKRLSGMAGGSYDRTDGHRDNMPFEQYGGYGRLAYQLARAWTVKGDVNITHFNASQPGAVTAPLNDADQRVTRGVTSVALENSYARTSGAVSLFYNWGNHWINDGYAPGGQPKDYRFRSKDHMAGLSVYQNFSFFEGNSITAGFDLFSFGGEAWNDYIAGEKDGQRADIADKTQDEIAGYVTLRQDVGAWLTVSGGLRADHHSDMGTEWIPQAGLAFHLPQAAEVKLSASKGFRYPTIREMYMFPPQNSDLRPERLWNYEAAFSQTLADGRLSWGVNLFYMKGDNLIVTVPRQGATPLNMNTGEVENSGVELQTAFNVSRHWRADANYSYLHMTNPVVASPQHKAYAGAAYAAGRLTVAAGLQYIGGLYTSVARDAEQTEDFFLLNLRASYKATRRLAVWLRGENLLAQRYEINAGYPMPRATVTAGVNVDF